MRLTTARCEAPHASARGAAFRHAGGYALLVVALSLAEFPLPVAAANHYLRAGATGGNTGTSWTNAWTTFGTVTWIRGDTYYVAGGIYNENVLVTKALAGTNWITVKKANPADNAADPGWDASYASLTATVNGAFELDDGYMELDGVTGFGTGPHGLLIWNTNCTTTLRLDGSSGPYHVLHCEIKGAGFAASTAGFDGVYNNNASVPQKGLHLAFCWIHQVTRNGVTLGGLVGTSYADYGLLFENNVISETGGCLDLGTHGQGMQISFGTEDRFTIIRGNTFRNIEGTGMVVWLGGPGSIHHDALVYNNLFYIDDVSTYKILSPGAIYAHIAASGCSNIMICNNTFHGLGSPNLPICALDTVGAINNVLQNNLWEQCCFTTPHRGFSTESNNGYFGNTGTGIPVGTLNQIDGSSSTLSNPKLGDFRLLPQGYAVGAGVNLSRTFATDFFGGVRGSAWDIGGCQYGADTGPAIPTAVRTGTPP